MLGIRRQGKVRGRSRRRCRSRWLWLVSVSLYRSGNRGAGGGSGSGSGLPCANKSKIHQPSAGQPAHMSNCWAGRSCNLMPQWEKCWASEWPKLHILFPRWMGSSIMTSDISLCFQQLPMYWYLLRGAMIWQLIYLNFDEIRRKY